MIRNVYYVVWMSNGLKCRDGWYATRKDAEFARLHHERIYGGCYSVEEGIIID